MALNSTSCAASISAEYDKVVNFDPVDYPAAFASAYESYSSAGVISVAVNSGGAESIIEGALQSAPLTPAALGDKFAEYWATIGTAPAPPYVSISNDALGRKSAFRAAVISSITDQAKMPTFDDFIKNIEGAVKTIVWTALDSNGVSYTSGVI